MSEDRCSSADTNRLRIWHVEGAPSPEAVDGANATTWQLAIEQARTGHDVTLFVVDEPSPAAEITSQRAGLFLFLPRHALLARRLHRSGIPYLVTPNSLAPALLKRRWIRKRLYVPLVEQRRLRRAAAIAVITEKEAAVIRGLVPGY